MARSGGGETRPEVDPDAAREAAREILGRPEYAEPGPGPVERVVDWFLDRAGSIIGTLTGGGPGSVVAWLVVAALVAGAAWLLVRAFDVPAIARPARAGEVHLGTETRGDPGLWRRESERLAAAGDHRGALRCRYQALVATLVLSGVVDAVPGHTSGDVRRQVGDRLPGTREAMDRVTDDFERAWYGGQPVGAGALERFVSWCETIEQVDRRTVPA